MRVKRTRTKYFKGYTSTVMNYFKICMKSPGLMFLLLNTEQECAVN